MKGRLRSRTEHPLTPKLEKVRNHSFEKPSGTRKVKRVRFESPGNDGGHAHVSARGRDVSQSPASDAPKTSEYAYFKKVRNGAGAVRGYSHSAPKENRHWSSSKIYDSLRENARSSGVVKPSFKEYRFSVEREEPSDHQNFPSPYASEYDEGNLTKIKEPTVGTGKNPKLFVHDVTPIRQCLSSSPLDEVPRVSEKQCLEKGIFAGKRKKLQQWAIQTLFPDVENPHLKGSELTSSLLSRLFPKGNENDDILNGQIDKSRSLILHEAKNLEKEIPLSHRKDWKQDLPNSGRPSQIVSWDGNQFAWGCPYSSYDILNAQNYSRDGGFQLNRMHRLTHTQHDSYFSLPLWGYRSPGHFHFEGLDEFDSVIGHSREEPSRLLLEWNSQKENHNLDSAKLNHDTTRTLAPRLTTSWNADQQEALDNVIGTERMVSPPIFSNHCLQLDSTDFFTQSYGPKFDDMSHATAESGQFSLALPGTPKCFTLAEDIFSNSNFIFSHGDQYWPRNEVWNGIHQDYFGWGCLQSRDSDAEIYPISNSWQFPQSQNRLYPATGLEEALGELLDPFSKGKYNNSLLLPNLNSSFDVQLHWPLLVNHVSLDKSDQELRFGDDDRLLEYR
ncbi:uncharacterized protein LOC127244139 [Andrographis paniculata]|uniref:uncharacterized protein LOC127244139 n=1 Tax=Andrographis paniculata TaxID=175694 RepID=UPI0021E7B39D|nr:uncharacterized protein LOC127244139 [Andrographis paniculata]